jgi:hypothetical protein
MSKFCRVSGRTVCPFHQRPSRSPFIVAVSSSDATIRRRRRLHRPNRRDRHWDVAFEAQSRLLAAPLARHSRAARIRVLDYRAERGGRADPPKAMPVILTTDEERDVWMRGAEKEDRIAARSLRSRAPSRSKTRRREPAGQYHHL